MNMRLIRIIRIIKKYKTFLLSLQEYKDCKTFEALEAHLLCVNRDMKFLMFGESKDIRPIRLIRSFLCLGRVRIQGLYGL